MPSLQEGGGQSGHPGAPQSTPVSSPFWMPSPQLGGGQGYSQLPPQSMPSSSPFMIPSSQVGGQKSGQGKPQSMPVSMTSRNSTPLCPTPTSGRLKSASVKFRSRTQCAFWIPSSQVAHGSQSGPPQSI